jgi:hypothetical protein
MLKNKKKSPGRPKKEFISKKPKTPTKAWPGRPRKYEKPYIANNQVPSAVVWFVGKSVDNSKKKDMVILLLFLLSFILFLASLYFTFKRDKKVEDLTQSEIAEIANIDLWNIDYTDTTGYIQDDDITTPTTNTTGMVNTLQQIDTTISQNIQALSFEQQMIVDFYQAVNMVDLPTMYTLTDARLESSNVFKTYYSKNWLSKFSAAILAPKIVVTNIQEETTTTLNPNIKKFSYTLEYVLVGNKQKFTEERSTVLLKKGDTWKIGTLLCETKGCSTMPFFNPDKYK